MTQTSQIFDLQCINGLPETSSTSDFLVRSTNKLSIYVASDPSGAKILIDGVEQTGLYTPSLITDLPSGYHNIKLISPGYIDVESSMPFAPGRTYNIFLTMGTSRQLQQQPYTSGLIILLTIGLGFLLLKDRKII